MQNHKDPNLPHNLAIKPNPINSNPQRTLMETPYKFQMKIPLNKFRN